MVGLLLAAGEGQDHADVGREAVGLREDLARARACCAADGDGPDGAHALGCHGHAHALRAVA